MFCCGISSVDAANASSKSTARAIVIKISCRMNFIEDGAGVGNKFLPFELKRFMISEIKMKVTSFHLRTCWRVCLLCIALLTILNFLIYHSHHITCYLHPNLCLPWTNWLKQLRNPPEMMTEEEFDFAAFQMWEHNVTVESACHRTRTRFINPCPSRLKLGILLGQRHGMK